MRNAKQRYGLPGVAWDAVMLASLLGLIPGCHPYDSGLLAQGAASAVEGCDGGCAVESCGDGVVDVARGETCDPGSPDTPCPESCSDHDDCTIDELLGSPEGCDAECFHRDVEEAIDGDGCCPRGGSSDIDSDCVQVCGNDVLEPGEECDPCPISCDDDDVCTRDERSGRGRDCNVVCDHVAIGQANDLDGCCPKGQAGATDADCESCGNGVVEGDEACDGEPFCADNCQLRFHGSLVHRYPFDGTGAEVSDAVGTAHGRAINTELEGTGTLELAGGISNQYVALPAGLISGLTSVTVEAWLDWDGGSSRQRVFDFGMNTVEDEGTTTGSGTSYFFVSPSHSSGNVAAQMNFTARANDRANDVSIEGPDSLRTGAVHHIAATFGSGRLALYVDGEQVASRSDIDGELSQIDDQNGWIGRANFAEDELDASMLEFRIYASALTASELRASFMRGPAP